MSEKKLTQKEKLNKLQETMNSLDEILADMFLLESFFDDNEMVRRLIKVRQNLLYSVNDMAGTVHFFKESTGKK